jgi:hypothetical protein
MMWEQQFAEVSAAAARQHGMITQAQLARIGVDERTRTRYVEATLLDEVDWSVYQISAGAIGPRFAFPLAAWLALAPESFRWERPEGEADAVLSHESAAAAHGLGRDTGSLFFTVPEEVEAPRGLTLRVGALQRHDVTVVEGIPATTPHRTVVDLVTSWSDHGELRRVLMDAVLKNVVDLRAIHTELAPLATRHEFPAEGKEFVEYFMPDLPPARLSPRNLRNYAMLVWPDRVASLQPRLARLLDEERRDLDPGLSWDLSAEIIGRLG